MEELILRAKRKDRDAMAQLAAEHYPRVFRVCARQLGSDAAADAAQETFINAQRNLHRFDHSSRFSTWLCGIALNVCRNHRRSRKDHPPLEAAWNETARGLDETGLVDRAALREALKTLPPDQLQTVLLHEVDGLTYEETAAALGIPVGTVKSRLHTAFITLRKAMTAEEIYR
jgi:RNA polymerase sigma-70 factor, ECF subfamily